MPEQAIKCKGRVERLLQGLQIFTCHEPFHPKLLEDVLQQKEELTKKEDTSSKKQGIQHKIEGKSTPKRGSRKLWGHNSGPEEKPVLSLEHDDSSKRMSP